MSLFKKIVHELNYLKAGDILQGFLMLVSLPVAGVYKLSLLARRREVWLVCEDRREACDNGFCFFKYLNEAHPEVDSRYAVDYRSEAYERVRRVGKTVRYGSLWHWVLYFCCKANISTQKSGKPNAAVCYVLEVFGIIRSRSVFLQHGITINKAEWLFYPNTKMRLFICGAKPEYDYVREYFGYPEKNVAYLGFNRFDDYHGVTPNPRQVVLMPSWREWIASKNEFSDKYEDTKTFTNTEYYQKYQELINDPSLIRLLEEKDLILYFYPHRNMQKYISDFSVTSDRIRIVTNETSNIRDLLMQSAVMITDYSSVAMDFAYMRKPVIYYQFDERRFREAQYAEGYFSYRDCGFGKVCLTCDETVAELRAVYDRDRELSPEAKASVDAFFPLYDNRNNQRIYEAIRDL